jgi:hypothetical protein
LSNHAFHRTISRLPRAEGGPRRKREHKRTATARYWVQQRAVAAAITELERLEDDDAEMAWAEDPA